MTMYEFMDEVPRKYHKVDFNQKGYGGEPEEVPREQANIISSGGTDGLHYPVLDLDIPAFLVPSSTPGHSHLFLNVGINPNIYFELLEALSKAGILEEGYVSASEARQYTAVRLPWVKKVTPEPQQEETPIPETDNCVPECPENKNG